MEMIIIINKKGSSLSSSLRVALYAALLHNSQVFVICMMILSSVREIKSFIKPDPFNKVRDGVAGSSLGGKHRFAVDLATIL
ncbi:MAG: hypothetical protein WBE18_04015 [Gammaproteobacteria bacterium]